MTAQMIMMMPAQAKTENTTENLETLASYDAERESKRWTVPWARIVEPVACSRREVLSMGAS
jgi:hypothetical protein